MTARTLALCSLLLLPHEIRAAEKWAGPAPPAGDALVLWLDASKQPAAWTAQGRPPLGNGAALDVFYDGSGNRLHLQQRVQTMQPHWRGQASQPATVRFDGKQFLGLLGTNRSLEDFSLFVVAAARSNPGNFSGLVAFHEIGKNDYLTGFNLDQGPFATDRLEWLNVEGRGFVGATNLLKSPHPFGGMRVIEVHCQATSSPLPPGEGAGVRGQGVKVLVDGVLGGSRKRDAGTLRIDNVVLGARCYSNSGDPPFIQGFFDGDIAEVLLFQRLLADKESADLRTRLLAKYAGWKPATGRLAAKVADPPPVQMLVPGFTVRQLPVDLANLNNLRYRDDGKLVALGYGGNVWLLSDTDGDGLEDKAELFWENKVGMRGPIGMALTPKDYAKGKGLFVASKGKVSLIVDTNGDDKADEEIIVAQGWKEIAQAVDAVGIALDKDGNIWFGLGCADFANAYQKTKEGKALYDIKSERGTIQKVSPDFSKRETICTGVRFPVSAAFNRHGDLFVTDQEGATWLPNGNPFDELLHIQPGRHYGFPPRHPQILPKVIDEPSTFDYGPQHQSTCGLTFNESVNCGPVFGPAHWEGDAIVTGESRGKLFRTKLVKTPSGYVAQNHVIAALQMLTVDCCVSPKGDLLVCCHSGPPDWGTGPSGKGKIFKISYTDKKAPQPLFAYAAGSCEVRIPFDKPLDPAHLKDLAKRLRIEYGPYVCAGDRFETLAPPYQVVKNQLATPRHDLPVLAVQVTPDLRTLIVTTAPHPEATNYAITLPGFGRPEKPGKRELPQHTAIDLGYDLCGVAARWDGAGSSWQGWLPHLDLAVSQRLTAGSAEHDLLWKELPRDGRLRLRCRLDGWHMLRPAVQPGATLDYELPAETVDVEFTAQGKIDELRATSVDGGVVSVENSLLHIQPREAAPPLIEIACPTGKTPPELRVVYATNADSRARALPLRRLLIPGAQLKAPEVARMRLTPEIQGGQWAKGREIFFSDAAQCSKCHQVRGAGGRIGADLSNLIHRDYDSVLRDIRFPSAAINPDYLSHVVTLKDGRTLVGTLRSEGGKQYVGTNEGKEIAIGPGDIDELKVSPVSVMPEGLDKKLSAEQLRDLLTFLLVEQLEPAKLERDGAPKPRTKAEVDSVLKGREPLPAVLKKLHIVLAAGPKDHGPGEHDYPLWQRRWVNLLQTAPQVLVSTAFGWPSPKQWETADVIVFYSHHAGWAADKAKDLDAFLERGGGLVYIHWAVAGKGAAEALAERIGLAEKNIKFRHGPLEVAFDPKHPITRNFGKVHFIDESYWKMTGDPQRIQVLGAGVEDGAAQPLFWTREQGKGRVFVSIPGHFTWTFDDPLFRILLLRGMAWTARQPVDRWSDLATVGARVEDK